jgi:hypothetical protein
MINMVPDGTCGSSATQTVELIHHGLQIWRRNEVLRVGMTGLAGDCRPVLRYDQVTGL